MQTRNTTEHDFWPYTKGIEISFNLIGRLPPTVEDIMVSFKSLHQLNQDDPARKRQSSLKEAANQTAKAAQEWWIRAGYKVRKEFDLAQHILKLDVEWKSLKRDQNQIISNKKKLTPGIELKQKRFIANGKKTFRVVSNSYEEYLQLSARRTTDSAAKVKFQEDLLYLQNMHKFDGDNRIGTIGGFDQHLASTSRPSRSTHSTPSRPSRSTLSTPSRATSSSRDSQAVEHEESSIYNDEVTGRESSDEPDSDATSVSSDASFEPYYKKKKDEAMTLTLDRHALEKASLQSDLNGVSIRQQLQYTSSLIQSSGGTIDDISLSRTSLDRFRKTARQKKQNEISDQEKTLLQQDDRTWVLHWDGKTFNKKTHAGKKQPVLAVVLKCLQDDTEILVDVVDMSNGSRADAECRSIINALIEIGLDLSKIVAVVFDTTAVNSGLRTGVTVQLQRHISHPVLQIACRHHIMELICGGAATVVYGDTDSPDESVFKKFAEVWHCINKQNYRAFSSSDRKLNSDREAALEFLMAWLMNTVNLREDYKKLLELTILFLGGTFPTDYKFTIKAPGAYTHSRWMARVIYSLMIALFRDQLQDLPEFTEGCDVDLDNVWSLAVFLSLYYVKYWFLAPDLTDAAVNDLELWNCLNDITLLSSRQLRKCPGNFKEMATAARNKLNNHLWFLTERHVVFALASDRVSVSVKVQMFLKLQAYRSSSAPAAIIGNGLVQMPIISKSTRLPDLIGPDSYTFFKIMPEMEVLISSNPRLWGQLPVYKSYQTLIQNIPATNDRCERVLGMASEVQKRSSAPKSDGQLRTVLKVTHSYRAAVRNYAQVALNKSKKADPTTKKFMKNFDW